MDGQNFTGHPRFPDSFSPVVEDWRERHVYGRVSQGAKAGDACVEFRDFHYRGVTVLQWLSYPLQRLSDGEREDPWALGDGMKASQLNWTNTWNNHYVILSIDLGLVSSYTTRWFDRSSAPHIQVSNTGQLPMEINRCIKIRLYPTPEQLQMILKTGG